MKDEQVDELLDDLDRALGVTVSPAVAQRARTEMSAASAGSWFGMRWLVIASAAACVVAAIGYLAIRESRVPGPPAVAERADAPVRIEPAPVAPAPLAPEVPPSSPPSSPCAPPQLAATNARRIDPTPKPTVLKDMTFLITAGTLRGGTGSVQVGRPRGFG